MHEGSAWGYGPVQFLLVRLDMDHTQDRRHKMSMTKKTYETVAKVLYQEWSSTSGMDVDEASSVQASVSAMTDDFVEAFKADNPLFREDWFRAACKGDWANVGGGR